MPRPIRKIVRDARAKDYRFSPLIVGNRQQHSVSDEEIRNDHHEEGPAAADVSARRGGDARAAAARRDDPVADRRWPTRRPIPARLRRLGFVYMPMGCDVTRWTPPGERRSTSCRRRSARSRR